MDNTLPGEVIYEAGEGMREPIDLESDANSQIAVYEHEHGNIEESMYSDTHQNKPLTSREVLNCSLQEVIDEINAKRKRDSSLLADYKKELDMYCSTAYASMEALVFSTYEDTNKAVEEKIQEFISTLERIAKLEAELEEFKRGLSALYTDVHGTNNTIQ